jgi:hypothetical protein
LPKLISTPACDGTPRSYILVPVTLRNFWIRWLQFVLGVLLLYSLMLVFAGGLAGELFTLLGFGPPETLVVAEGHDYLRLPLMVLGAVLAGWSVLMLLLVRGPLRAGQSWVAGLLFWPVIVWFVLDTGMSLTLGYPSHALFNLPFFVSIGLPLLMLRSRQEP